MVRYIYPLLIWCVYVESLFCACVCVILPQHYRCSWISGAGFNFLAHDVRLHYFLVTEETKNAGFSLSLLNNKLKTIYYFYMTFIHIQRETEKFRSRLSHNLKTMSHSYNWLYVNDLAGLWTDSDPDLTSIIVREQRRKMENEIFGICTVNYTTSFYISSRWDASIPRFTTPHDLSIYLYSICRDLMCGRNFFKRQLSKKCDKRSPDCDLYNGIEIDDDGDDPREYDDWEKWNKPFFGSAWNAPIRQIKIDVKHQWPEHTIY